MSKEKNSNYQAPSALPSRKLIPPFEALRAFDAIARLGGVRKAAQALYRDHAVISRHMRALEDWTGCKLIERTPAGAVLTEDGRQYHQRIRVAIDTIADATVDVIKRNQDHSLQLWSMPGFALHWLIGHIDDFEKQNPDIELQLRSTHEIPDFSRQDADVDIRMLLESEKPDSKDQLIRCSEIASPPVVAVASPEYLAQYSLIESPEQMLQHQLLHEEDFDNWRLWFEACGLNCEQDLSGPRLWDGHMTLAAARRGRGIALSNQLVAREDLESGVLVEIGCGNDQFKKVSLWTYWFIARSDRWESKAVSQFRDWLQARVQAELAE